MAIPFLKGIDVAGTADLSNLTIDGAQGTDGQVLTSTGSGVAWENPTGTIDGSGSANKVAFWTDADTLSFDSKLHWDSTNGRLGINKTNPNAKLHVVTGNNDQQHSVTISHTRNDSNVGTQALKVDANFSGADTTTADRTNAGLYVDLDSSADGDASHEVRSYGIWVDARITGFNDILRGGFFNVESNNQDEKTAEIVGVYGSATHDSSSTNGGVSNMYGARGVANIQDYGDIDNTYAVHGLVQIANNRNANVDNAHAIYGEIQIDEADALTYGNMYGARIVIDNNEGSVPNFSNQYLFFGDYQGTEATGSYGLYIDGSRHYLANKLGIGVTNPSEALDVSGNANVSGTISTDSDGSSTNWKQAYDNHITGVAVTGTSTKTITLTQRDGGTITTTFTDQTGSGLTMTNGVDNRLVTASGIASINGESGLLFGGSSLEVTPGDIATPLHVKRTSASTRQVNLLLHANDGSSTSEGFLGCDSSSNLRWGGSGNTSLNSLILTEDNLDFVVSSSTNNAIVRLAGGGTNFANFSIGGAAGAITVNSGTNSITIGHHDTSSASSVDNSGNTVIQDVTLDTYGHVTGLSSKTLTIPTVYNGTLTVQGTGALGGSGTFTANQSTNATISISHDDTSSQSSVNNSGNTVIQDVTLDTYGHVTGLTSKSLSIPTVNNATLTVQGTGALGGSGTFTANQAINSTISISHDDTSSQSSINNSNGTVIQDVTLDGYGHVTGLGSVNLDNRFFRRYTGSVSSVSSSGYTTAFTVDGGNLASHISFSVQGTTSSVVVSNLIDLTVNHYQDIMLEALSGVYTQLSVKVISNNNEDFAVELKTNSSNAVTLYIEVIAYGSESVTFTNSHSYSSKTLEATLPPGKYIKGTGGDNGDLEIGGVFRGDGSGLTSISYNDLDNKPTIPTVNNATLTVQGTGALGGSGTFTANQSSNATISISHDDTSSQSSVNNSGRTYIQDITLDGYGHVTGISSATETVTNTDTNNYASSIGFNTGNGVLTINRSGLSAITKDIDGRYAYYDHIRSLGNRAFTGTATTAGLISEMEGDGAFDSYTSVFKTSWSYAGNFNLSDAGRFTETAGTSWITWTDNSSDSTRGNITALAIAPNTGGSAGKVFIYNDQGSSYAPGWREVWTSTSDGAGSGLDADLLDGQQGSYYLDYNNFTNTPTSSGISQSDADTRYINATGDTMGGTLNMGGNTLTLHTSGGSPGLKSYYGTVNVINGSSAGTLYVGTGNANASGSVYATTVGGGSNTKVVYSTSHHRYYVGSSTEEMRLESDGDLHLERDVIAYSTTVSDIRLKDDVVTIDNALDKVCKLRGVEYTWNKGGRKNKRDLGVIAQEVEKVLPEIVKEKKMPLIDDSDTVYKTVDYEKLSVVLIEAVKEQQAQIDELTTILEEVTKQLNNGNNV